MLCENCKKNEANVRYTQVINGVKKEMHLCENCSKMLGINDMSFNIPIDFSSYFGEFLNDYNNDFIPVLEKEKPLVCDRCKMTYDEFIENGKFGCGNCYETFSNKIDSILKRLHGSNKYVGKKIKKQNMHTDKKEIKKINEIDEKQEKTALLKEELKKMIKEEKYEEAAKIRDEIKNIEGK